MPGIIYSAMAFLAIIIHCIINKDNLKIKKDDNLTDSMKSYRRFLRGIMAYYITDTLWGLLDELGWVSILKADTFIYYIAMAIAVVLWTDYVVAYLNQKNLLGKILRYFGQVFIAFVLVTLVINLWNPIFFWFDEAGTYYAGPVRYMSYYTQVALFLFSTIQTLVVAAISKGARRRRQLAISLFGISMTVAIIGQILYPLLPIYSVGYLIGACFLHVYVEEDEQDEHFENLQKQMDIISSMAGIYFCSYYVDMRDKTFVELDNKISENNEFIGKKGDAVKKLDQMCTHLVLPQYTKEMREFTNLDTLNERLSGKEYYISREFESVHIGWAEGFFIAGDKDENDKLRHVIWAIRTIRNQKMREEKLLYNSYVDELTGLYNRKMYEEDITENITSLMDENFVYVSLDVNGLKVINDSKGHVAGDELIRGAADCMKRTLGGFGRIYRVGGDEFVGLLNVPDNQLEQLQKDFEDVCANFKGKFINSISVSAGYVAKQENFDLTIDEISKLADKNMYLAKRRHYATSGVDRRAQQQNAYKALCIAYTKILMVNLTENTFSIIFTKTDEQSEEKGFSNGFFEWLEDFAKSGQVHPDDVEQYEQNVEKDYLCNYFIQNKNPLDICYRRKIGEEYKSVIMQIIPAENYADDNQNVFLYVKYAD